MNAKLILALLALGATSLQAQVVRVVPEAFPIAPAQAALPIKPMVASPAAGVDRRLVIKSGELISPLIVDWALRNGFTLTWDAAEYRSQADLVLSDEFEKALNMFLGSMRLNKARLEAEIYANNAVRILEVK